MRNNSNINIINKKHNQGICRLKWNEYDNYLVSGGNDNKINVFDYSYKCIFKSTFNKAAVKSIEWNNLNTFFSGSGTNGGQLCYWNINNSNDPVFYYETKS